VQVYDAIEGDVDGIHRLMHSALAGYLQDSLWRLSSLPSYAGLAATAESSHVASDFADEWADQRCPSGEACPGIANSTCAKWHDTRELRFAKEHLCRDFLTGTCTRTACPNAHGFSEIRDAMNDASPICWKWLEGRCRVPHCKYAHTFRRHHGASMDSRRSNVSTRPPSFGRPSTASAAAPSSAPPSRGSNDFAQRRLAARGGGQRNSNSLDASGHRRASFGHSRASIEGADGSDWKQHGDVAELPGVAKGGVATPSPLRKSLDICPPRGSSANSSMHNVALDSAFTRQARVAPLQSRSVPSPHGGPPGGAHRPTQSALGSAPSARESLEAARACLMSAYDDPASSGSKNGFAPQQQQQQSSLSSSSTSVMGRSNVSRW
jgi:hypothetical protein